MTEPQAPQIRQLAAPGKRVETGLVQFGDDWPGVFVRGDAAGYHAFNLKRFLESPQASSEHLDPIVKLQLVGLQQLLSAAVVGGASEMVRLEGAAPAAPAASPAPAPAAGCNEGRTWGFFDAAGKPVGGQGKDRWACPKGRWEPNVQSHPITGEDFQDQQYPNAWVSECRMKSVGVKRESCECGMVFIYP